MKNVLFTVLLSVFSILQNDSLVNIMKHG